MYIRTRYGFFVCARCQSNSLQKCPLGFGDYTAVATLFFGLVKCLVGCRGERFRIFVARIACNPTAESYKELVVFRLVVYVGEVLAYLIEDPHSVLRPCVEE